MIRLCVTLLAIVALGSAVDIPGVKTTQNYDHSAILDEDGKYILFWSFNDTHIIFESHVSTKGWVGLGISTNGQMAPADVAVGWVLDDGTTHFFDRHTTGRMMPVQDRSQDWHLLYGEENELGTVLKMVRKLKTCDTNDDIDIEEGTNRIIYAYGQADPASDNSIHYHGHSSRGTKSLSLLAVNVQPDSMGKVKHWDFLMGNVLIPNDSTTYWCRGFNMPPIGKHHMVKYEPVLTPGNEMNVHHIVLYRCKVDNPQQYNGVTTDCYDKHRTLPGCSDIVIAWAIGGEPFYFPDNVGFSIGGPEDESFYIMETHFDNPTLRNDIIDDSGIRITITENLRQHEAGMLELGSGVNFFQIIPPGEPAFVSKGYCHERCLEEGFKQSNVSEIKIFGALQHSHLLGVAITTRHYRNGAELKPVMTDPNYDFDFQEVRMLPKEVSVLPGDSFRVDCTYDSTGRTDVTYGGLSTKEEMCLTFAYYYPKFAVANCLSLNLLTSMYPDTEHLYQYVHQLDWTNRTVVEYYKKSLATSSVYQVCEGFELKKPDPALPMTYVPTEPSQPYTPPPPDCS